MAHEAVREICDSLPARYSPKLSDQITFLLGRIEPLVSRGLYNCEISFDKIPLQLISVRDADREATAEDGYPQLQRDLLSFDYDSVPIACGRQGERTAVWDGHHRLRTYELAGRGYIPALVATFVRGYGLVTVRR